MGGFKRPSNENNEKKEMIPLTNKEKESYESQKIFHICVQEFGTDENNKKCKRSENIVITQGNIEELLIVFAIYATKNTKRDSSSIS